jgi:predicted aminopeptidase
MHYLLLIFLLSLTSCAKVSYVTGQGIGQLALEWNGQANEKILADPNVKEEYKVKIQNIIKYKKFFYDYFQQKATPIYDETTFLKTEAVTYLVIASDSTEIKPVMTSFPIVGSFPYLGFFDKEKALKYQKQLERENLVTYMRPVYAYTTLNKLPFYDNILSSFFVYDDHHLAELIFHELVHTIFFAKDEVDFNEALADYLAKHLTYEYFDYDENEKNKWQNHEQKEHKLMQLIVEAALELNTKYRQTEQLSSEKAQQILSLYVQEKFEPKVSAFCAREQFDKCWPLKMKWNNAAFAAFMTYSKEQNLIEDIHKKYQFDIKGLLAYIEKNYKQYKSSDMKSFVDYLKQKEKL